MPVTATHGWLQRPSEAIIDPIITLQYQTNDAVERSPPRETWTTHTRPSLVLHSRGTESMSAAAAEHRWHC